MVLPTDVFRINPIHQWWPTRGGLPKFKWFTNAFERYLQFYLTVQWIPVVKSQCTKAIKQRETNVTLEINNV